MQFTTAFVALFAAVAVAVPTGTVPTCSGGDVGKCCTGVGKATDLLGAIIGIDISVPIGIGCIAVPVGGCNTKAACCSGDTKQVGLVNVDLDCVQIL